MQLAPRDTQAFRGQFTYRNSPEAVRRFPFPFPEDDYMYSVNTEPHTLPCLQNGEKLVVYGRVLSDPLKGVNE